LTCLGALRYLQDEAGPPPVVPVEFMDRIEYQLGYRLGWRNAISDAIELIEEQEEDEGESDGSHGRV
jgi:hypothetical protein